MSYCCGDGCRGGYASNQGSSGYAANQSDGSTATYTASTPRESPGFIGCTCGGHGPCRGTCRTPMPE